MLLLQELVILSHLLGDCSGMTEYWVEHVQSYEVASRLEEIYYFLDKLEPAFFGRMTVSDLIDYATRGKMFFDIVRDYDDTALLLLVLEIDRYPQGSCLRIVGVSGNLRKDTVSFIVDYTEKLARNIGARFIEFEGRPGWVRLLKGYDGWNSHHVMMVRQLEYSDENSHEDRMADDGQPRAVRTA